MTAHSGNFEVDPQLKEEYVAYGQSTLDDIEKALHALGTEDSAPKMEDIRRQIHSLKGTGTSYGFPEITKICAVLEDSIKQQKLGLLDLLLDGIKDMRKTLKKPA